MKSITKIVSLLLLAAATQYSCINDADVAVPENLKSDSDGNLALIFEIPNANKTRSAESSGNNEEGSKEEYAINSLTIYLFDSKTKTFIESHELENIQMSGNNEQRINYSANKITVKPGTYNIFAIANGKAVTNDIATQDKFLGAIDAVTYSTGKIPNVPANGFVMTNRGAANLNVEVSKPTDSDKVTSVKIGLERVVAKVEVTQTEETFPLKDPSGKTYVTVKLTNFRMLNLATQFYTFRHTAALTSLQEPESYTDVNFGDVNNNNGYVIDPYFFKKTVEGAKDFTNADGFFAQALVQLNINDNNWAGMSQANSWSRIYCLENCMYQTSQLNAYSTGIMFKATLNIANDCVFNEKGEQVDVYLNLPDGKLVMDRTRSGVVDFGRDSKPHAIEAHDNRKTTSINYIDDFALATWGPVAKATTYRLNIFVDKCSVEIFLNGGKIAMTNLVFPNEPYNRVSFYSKGGKYEVDSLHIYKLEL